MTRDEIIQGLKAGRTLIIQRKDDPVLPIVMDLQQEGIAEIHEVEVDEQTTKWKVTYAGLE